MAAVKKDKRIVVSLDNDFSSTSCYNIKKVKAASTSAAASFGRVVQTSTNVVVGFEDFVPSNFLKGLREPGLFNPYTAFEFTRAGTYSVQLTLVPDSFVVQPTGSAIELAIERGNIGTSTVLTTSRDGYSPYVATFILRGVEVEDIMLFPTIEGINLYGLASGFVVTRLDTQPGPSTLQTLIDAARKVTAVTTAVTTVDATSKEADAKVVADTTSNVSVAKPTESKIDEITEAIKKPAEPSKQSSLNIRCLKH